MKNLYKLPKRESMKDNRLDIGFALILMGMLLILIALVSMKNSYNKALNGCIDGGNSKEYCEMMLN